jgi:hypothetical protein
VQLQQNHRSREIKLLSCNFTGTNKLMNVKRRSPFTCDVSRLLTIGSSTKRKERFNREERELNRPVWMELPSFLAKRQCRLFSHQTLFYSHHSPLLLSLPVSGVRVCVGACTNKERVMGLEY